MFIGPSRGRDRADGRQGAGQGGGGGAPACRSCRVLHASRRHASRDATRCWSRPRRAAAGAGCAWSSAPDEPRRGDGRRAARGRRRASATTASSSSASCRARGTSRSRSSATRTATCSRSASASARSSAATRRCSRSRRRRSSSPELRETLGRGGGRAGAAAAGYVGAGTVEFIADADDPADALLPGDERAAAGRAPGHRARHRPRPRRAAAAGRRGRAARRRASTMTGHAIEARVNAEDAALPPVRRPGPARARTRAACAWTPRSRPARVGRHRLRLDDRQGDRPRPGPRDRARAAGPRAGRHRDPRPRRPTSASCAPCSRATTCARARWTRA